MDLEGPVELGPRTLPRHQQRSSDVNDREVSTAVDADGTVHRSTPSEASRISVSLLGGFELRQETLLVPLPLSAQRLVAFLAVQTRARLRIHVAGTLWPYTTDTKAAANLRSTLWRLRRPSLNVVTITGQQLALASDVTVDTRQLLARARSVIECSGTDVCPDLECASVADDLLPGWYEDWVLVERERLRQLFVHALENLCHRRSSAGWHAQAVEAGLAAVAVEPLRESAQRALVSAHLAEGNVSEALRQYRAYEQLLEANLGIRPSPLMQALVKDLGAELTRAG